MMQASIATVSISGDLKEKTAAIASAGFDGVGIFDRMPIHLDVLPASRGRVARAADQ